MACYRIREDFGRYAVVEVRTGEIAKAQDRWLECLERAEADEALDQLMGPRDSHKAAPLH